MKIGKYSTSSMTAITFGIVVALSSCMKTDPNSPGYEYMPDMYRSPSYETYSVNPNFADGMTAQKPVEGTITRGEHPYAVSAINNMPFAYADTKEDYERVGVELTNPIELTPAILADGKVLYEKYCTHCHGATGQGDGKTVTAGGFPPPPSYSAGMSSRGGAMKDLSAGKIFHAITYGVNMMGPHASQLNKEERWKITHYVQTLQKQ